MNDLYIVSTYYHALIACVRHINNGGNADIMVTNYIPQHEMLAERLIKSELFERTFPVGKIEEYRPSCWLDYALNNNCRNKRLVEDQLGFSLNNKYKNIYIFHDDTWIARYLKCARIPYHLLEDALDSFKIICDSSFAYMVHKDNLKMRLKNILRLGYTYCGYDRYTKSVEVNSIDGVKIKHLAKGKLVELPRKPMFDKLSDSDIVKLKNIFMKDIPELDSNNSMLLLTQPLYVDRIVEDEAKQAEIYRRLAEKHIGDLKLVVKPHPRDSVDYTGLFPDATLLDKDMPLEIVAMIIAPHFAKIVSLGSTCTNAIRADEYIKDNIEDL
ncbi:MAG: hypothetical protein IJD85_01605 [Oscillospiraceae bacterium]|nr:hypothetical protein [Oscillospiraceae bacterium]